MKPIAALLASALISASGLAQAQNDAADPALESGGLAPPPAVEGENQEQPPSATEQDLDRAEKEDSGRGLEFFWLNAEIGGEHLGLQTFKANDLVDAKLVASKETGMVYGAGLGLRLLVFTLGGRFRLAHFSNWDLWTLNGELGLHIPIGNVEPYFTFGGGYASLGSFGASNLGSGLNSAGVDVTGFNVRGGFGIDIYLSKRFSIGGNLTGDVLFLSRPKLSAEDASKISGDLTPEQRQVAAEVYAKDGSSIGAGATLTFVAGLHF
jgi:hypothetical protein